MKHLKGIVSLTLALMLTVSTMIPAMASNSGDTYITGFVVPYATYFKVYPNARNKDDYSSMYLKITESVFYNVLVQARGIGLNEYELNGATELNTSNQTLNSSLYGVTYVTCSRGINYSIHNTIKESGYGYATFAFRSPSNGGGRERLSGVWSPDSVGSYTDAS